jgi:hypothetical protein
MNMATVTKKQPGQFGTVEWWGIAAAGAMLGGAVAIFASIKAPSFFTIGILK